MLMNSAVLAISSSIDSLGIGITYGIKNTTISRFGKIILFIISFLVTTISITIGNNIKEFFPKFVTNFIGFFILILMGAFVIFQALRNNCKNNFDLDFSNSIDWKEAIFLGLALSLDSFCIGIVGSVVGINYSIFPFLISAFQLLFISLGNILGKKLHNISSLPNNIWSIVSGFLLILIGISKLIF